MRIQKVKEEELKKQENSLLEKVEKLNISTPRKRTSLSEDDESSDDCQPRIDYFQDISMRVKKSDNTLKSLDLSVIKSLDRCSEKDGIKEIVIEHYEKELFSKIYSLLTENFSVILYGLGSKKNLLDAFKDRWLADEKFLKIYGYFLELNLKVILIKLGKLFDLNSINEADFYDEAANLDTDIYLIVHSIDVLFKTDPKIKSFLINLYVKCNGKLHIVATVDHINAALMFDLIDEEKLNLVCFETPTYESFQLERAYSTNSKKNKKGLLNLDEQTLTINGIMNVYKSLPENSKQVLMLIFKEWIENKELRTLAKKTKNKNDDDTNGLAYARVLLKCRQQFLVSSGKWRIVFCFDLCENSLIKITMFLLFKLAPAFKQQLVEFTDHNLMRNVKIGGSECIVVQIEDHIITRFINEIENPTTN